MLKKYLISFLYFLVPFLVLLFIVTIGYYFDIISINGMKYFKLIIVLLSSFLGGFKIGMYSNQKGYIKGIIFGSILSILFFIVTIFTKNFKITTLLYYFILIIITTIGSMIGIFLKK